MKTVWDNYKTLHGAKRQAVRNKKQNNDWQFVRRKINGRFALETSPSKDTVWPALAERGEK